MKILVTNDDGIDSPGIRALAEAMSRVGEVLIVAPDQEQSGVGTARIPCITALLLLNERLPSRERVPMRSAAHRAIVCSWA